jgi:hypothetical protein
MLEQPFQAATITRRLACCETGQATLTSCLSCTARGLSCPLALARGGGLLPRRFTLASSTAVRSSRRKMERFIFCDTFRRKELSFSAPPLSQGMPPCGVRTFLSGVQWSRSDRPPTNKNYTSILCPFKARTGLAVEIARKLAEKGSDPGKASPCARRELTRKAWPSSVPSQTPFPLG